MFKKKTLLVSLCCLCAIHSSFGILNFSLDAYDTDSMTFTITGTLSNTPSSLANNLYFYNAGSGQWLTGLSNANIGNQLSASPLTGETVSSNLYSSQNDEIGISFDSNLTTSNTGSASQVTFTLPGYAGTFQWDQVSEIGLRWGFDSVQSTTAVPEPESYAALFALGIVGFAFLRRYRKA